MDIYELDKNIKHYAEKTLKIYNYILFQYMIQSINMMKI